MTRFWKALAILLGGVDTTDRRVSFLQARVEALEVRVEEMMATSVPIEVWSAAASSAPTAADVVRYIARRTSMN